MPSTHTMLLFALASAGLVALPGPAVIYIVTRGVAHGRRGALVSMLGVEAGNYVEVLAATVGLAAIIASSATAFTAVKLIGAAYLIWLGIRALTDGIGAATADDHAAPLGAAPVPGGLRGRRPESEAGDLPARVPAPVRRRRRRPGLAADAGPGFDLQPDRLLR